MTDEPTRDAPPDLLQRRLIRDAVVHIINEQPLVADLFGLPEPGDVTLVCTNVRMTTGKRPAWADDLNSVFYFPWRQIRFLEVPPASVAGGAPMLEAGEPETEPEPVDEEPELEIDEEFLRRVREV